MLSLTNNICNELLLCYVLKGYFTLKYGKEEWVEDQYINIAHLYNGKLPNHPSLIKLLCEGSYFYRGLFDYNIIIVTAIKDTINSVNKFTLSNWR